jgi:hypothetical protein
VVKYSRTPLGAPAGHLGLYRAAGKHGGIRYWADELGFSDDGEQKLIVAA